MFFRKKPKMPDLSRDELRYLPFTVNPDELVPFLVSYKKTMDACDYPKNGLTGLVLDDIKKRARRELESLPAKDSEGGGRLLQIIASGSPRCGDCKHLVESHESVPDPIPTAIAGPCSECSCKRVRYLSL